MRVAVIDVGSNTVRLLVAALKNGCVKPVREERTAVGLAREIERTGRIPREKISRAADVARRYVRDASKAGAEQIDALVTAPGRQSENGDELVAAIASATGVPVRGLSAEEEGALAFTGVLSTFTEPPRSLAVVDVGGGSTQIVFGTADGPAWFKTLDIGSLRLAQRHLTGDPPTKSELGRLRESVEESFTGVVASPLPRCAVATGGTARALRKLVGRTLGPKELERAQAILRRSPASAIAEEYRIPRWRAEIVPAGVVVLAAAQRRLGVPLVVARAGLREGAVLQSLVAEKAA
jgi:exopolyphosphatase / guanosine-5'-triphosphate,3'-diphosphate pyrophosphatase